MSSDSARLLQSSLQVVNLNQETTHEADWHQGLPARFAMCGLSIVKVGINFDEDKRTIGDWKITS